MEDRTSPDWRADAWYLERQHREHYGKDAVVAVEITGLAGTAGQDDQPVDLTELAERLDRTLFSVEYPPELEDGSVVDAEIVN